MLQHKLKTDIKDKLQNLNANNIEVYFLFLVLNH